MEIGKSLKRESRLEPGEGQKNKREQKKAFDFNPKTPAFIVTKRKYIFEVGYCDRKECTKEGGDFMAQSS